MLNIVSLGFGVVSLLMALVAFLPFLGWANWLILPLPLAGVAIGIVSSRNEGRNLNLVVLAIAVVRLAISPVI
ncbi:hypothetical protein [Sphingomonas sp. ID0503]|uniref:hypothetical protein n=1 Tax=Sphingomonas sp. ID0503 TaxID=3399691 RepID=UPI003AFA307B